MINDRFLEEWLAGTQEKTFSSIKSSILTKIRKTSLK